MFPRWLAIAAALPGAAAAQQLAYEGTLSAATGNYFFTEPTTTWSLVSGLALSGDAWTLRFGVPVFLQNTTLVSASGNGMMPTGGSLAGDVSAGGSAQRGRGERMAVPANAAVGYAITAGDPLVQASWHAVRARRTTLTVGVGIKPPVTDTSAFGTGAWDAGATASVMHQATDVTLLAFDASYWHLGDLAELDLRDPVVVSLGVGRRFASRWVGSATVTAGTSALRGYEGPVSASIGIGRLNGRALWNVTASAGFTETVPDVAVTIGWRLVL